jgi:hypothetical protein
MSLRIGVLTEDETDSAALGVLIRRIAKKTSQLSVGVDPRHGNGCSHLRRKAEANLRELAQRGCAGVVLLHDLDRNPSNGELNDERELRRRLDEIAVPDGLQRLVCIPVEELEAWFWADPSVVQEVGRGRGQDHASPHAIKKPKEALMRLSLGANHKPRYSTNDNVRLADKLDLDLCARRCPSFHSLREFVLSLLR